jgi:hypothetical protein
LIGVGALGGCIVTAVVSTLSGRRGRRAHLPRQLELLDSLKVGRGRSLFLVRCGVREVLMVAGPKSMDVIADAATPRSTALAVAGSGTPSAPGTRAARQEALLSVLDRPTEGVKTLEDVLSAGIGLGSPAPAAGGILGLAGMKNGAARPDRLAANPPQSPTWGAGAAPPAGSREPPGQRPLSALMDLERIAPIDTTAQLVAGSRPTSARVVRACGAFVTVELTDTGAERPVLGEPVRLQLPASGGKLEVEGLIVHRASNRAGSVTIQATSPPTPAHRRTWLRVRATLPARLWREGESGEGAAAWTRDLTPIGAALALPDAAGLAAGSRARVRIQLPDSQPVELQAMITRVAESEDDQRGAVVALRFTEVGAEDRDRITQYLLQRQAR